MHIFICPGPVISNGKFGQQSASTKETLLRVKRFNGHVIIRDHSGIKTITESLCHVCFVESQIDPFRLLSNFFLTWEFTLPSGTGKHYQDVPDSIGNLKNSKKGFPHCIFLSFWHNTVSSCDHFKARQHLGSNDKARLWNICLIYTVLACPIMLNLRRKKDKYLIVTVMLPFPAGLPFLSTSGRVSFLLETIC